MSFFKRGAILVCILSFVVLAACTMEQTQTENPKSAKTTAAKETVEEKIPLAARTVEEMVDQKAGALVEKHMDQQLETLGGWDSQQYRDFLEQTFNPIAEKEFKTYLTKHKNLSGEQVYDYLVYQLGSGNYQNYYEQLVTYEHGFVMPELPNGADEVTTKQKKMNVLVLMDASGSMKGKITGQTKMELAKAAIAKFVGQIPGDANLALITYGHVGTSADSDKITSCSSVEAVYPLSAYQAENFTNSLNSFQASGWTPLAGAINKAGEILQAYPSDDYSNLVYIVSDGVETCDGDPVAAAGQLQSQNIKAKVNIIGFNVDNEGQQQLKQVADSGAGEYVTVENPAELEVQITKKWQPTLGQLAWTQGVTMQQWIGAMDRMNKIYNPLYTASDAELNRIQHAAYFLYDEKLISDEVEKQVLELAESMHDLRNEHFKAIKEDKESERKQVYEEINAKVEEWRQQWQ
ncbi:vWA domain-containing protein [Neobacillus jeddahensis]|uniref:vWA domain-containing protein n=1 Tax=Neobacillus jeddahensis TaxID=1461580 RepID=UPI000590EE94|nr:VWA domain-containing protein [Neobacillus jeddahensis]